MKALTIWQPWASAIAYGTKAIENRPWAAPRADIGQLLAIHAGKTVDLGARPPDGESWPARPMPTGAILAVATLQGSHGAGECARGPELCSPWAQPGQWHLELADVRPLAVPVPCRGFQKLWTVPDEAEAAVHAQMEER